MKKPPVINDGDYLIDEKKLYSFLEKVRVMADQEFGIDVDGDSLVEVQVVDRTRYEYNGYFNIAYDHKAKTDKDRDNILKDLLSNLQHSSSRVSQMITKLSFEKKL